MKIPKMFKGRAASILSSLLRYKPPAKVEVMSNLYDPAEDGPEVQLCKFFRQHPDGYYRGIKRCLHMDIEYKRDDKCASR